MTETETLQFEHNLSCAFHWGECRYRELRLSSDEAAYLQATYPAVHMTPLDECLGKRWYEVWFRQ